MSWSSRFIEKKSEDGWQTVTGGGRGSQANTFDGGAAAGGGGGGSYRQSVPMTNSAFAGSGGGSGSYSVQQNKGSGWGAGRTYGGSKKLAPEPTVDFGSEADFPSLGGSKKAAAAAPKPSGFATLASAWAEQDASERAAAAAAAAARRAADEEEAKAAARRDNSIMTHVFRLRNQVATVSMHYDDEEEAGDDLDCDAYGRRPRSPPYDPDPHYEGVPPPMTEEGDDDWTMKE